jgi:catechol 1,2-dioxygenase, proteobacterial
MDRAIVDSLLNRLQSNQCKPANERVKVIVDRIVHDLFHAMNDLNVTPDEFWTAVNYLTEAGRNNEFGLIAAGLGFEHFLDVMMDEQDKAAGVEGGTPRTIEGPLYVAGAPVCQGEGRLDDGTEQGEVLFMDGVVTDTSGKPIAGAQVEVWHANTLGNYSYFDKSQSAYNLRRTIVTDAEGRYRFRSILPSGYGCPPNGSTQQLLDQLGRHGRRPAHIHFFVSAPDHRKLTTQINIDGDEYLHDDFAFATRDGLIPAVVRHTDATDIHANGLNAPFATITFDFALHPLNSAVRATDVQRLRAEA